MSAHTTVRTGQSEHATGLDANPAAAPPAAYWTSDEDRLDAALVGLSLLTADPLRLEEVLIAVAQLGQRAVPGAKGAGLRILRAAPPAIAVASTEVVRELHAVQQRLQEGPCLTAEAEARTVRCDSLPAQQLWPRFHRGVRHLDVHSVLSLPLVLGGHVLGSITVYAHERDAFTERAVTAADRFVRSATVTVRIAQLFDGAQHRSSSWQVVNPARHVIDQALGVIVTRTGCTPVHAFEQLHVASQRARRTVSAVAAEIVDDAQQVPVSSQPRPR